MNQLDSLEATFKSSGMSLSAGKGDQDEMDMMGDIMDKKEPPKQVEVVQNAAPAKKENDKPPVASEAIQV